MANIPATVVALFLVFWIADCQRCLILVEKGHYVNLHCTPTSNVKSITWQLWTGRTQVNLSTCNFENNTCTDHHDASLYQGFISSIGDSKKIAELNITSARVNETHFTCVPDTGIGSGFCELNVYAWPVNARCWQSLNTTYVDYTCTTDNVYPGISVTLHRIGIDFSRSDIDLLNSKCVLGDYGSGTEGDFSAACTLRIPMEKMIPLSFVYAEMYPIYINKSVVNRPGALSDQIITSLSVPQIVVYKRNCPVGSGVRGNSIQIGTQATCKCEMLSVGFPPGFARWLTKDKQIVGEEDKNDKSSTLTFSYNPSDPNPEYKCIPFTPLITSVNVTIYKPSFHSP